jgi:hypothetical protein
LQVRAPCCVVVVMVRGFVHIVVVRCHCIVSPMSVGERAHHASVAYAACRTVASRCLTFATRAATCLTGRVWAAAAPPCTPCVGCRVS